MIIICRRISKKNPWNSLQRTVRTCVSGPATRSPLRRQAPVLGFSPSPPPPGFRSFYDASFDFCKDVSFFLHSRNRISSRSVLGAFGWCSSGFDCGDWIENRAEISSFFFLNRIHCSWSNFKSIAEHFPWKIKMIHRREWLSAVKAFSSIFVESRFGRIYTRRNHISRWKMFLEPQIIWIETVEKEGSSFNFPRKIK